MSDDAAALMGAAGGLVDELDAQRAFATVAAGLLGGPSATVRVGRFVLLDRVGAGGMGVVYSAYDPQLDRKVAIKVLHARHGDTRLLTEARALARLTHPNVVTVHEVGTFDGRPFLAMELVIGAPLATWFQSPRPWREVLRVMITAAEGLAAAHDAGVVHRDFKPSNVLIDDKGRVIVLDFGLASTGIADAEEPASDGAVGSRVGTPAYMAPEQHRGEPATAASDQFAWCVSTYEGVVGQLPFATRSRTQLLEDIEARRLAPVPDDRRHPPAWLRRVLIRGLHPLPAERWPSMAALRAELQRRVERRWERTALPAAGLVVAGALTWSALRSDVASCTDEARAARERVWNDDTAMRTGEALAAVPHTNAAALAAGAINAASAYASAWEARRTQACRARRDAARGEREHDDMIVCLDAGLEGLAAAVELFSAPEAGVLVDAQNLVPRVAEIEACVATVVDDASAAPGRSRLRGDVERNLERAAVLGRAGRYDEARRLVATALTDVEAAGDVALRARARNTLGFLDARQDEHAAAIAAHQSALVDAEQAGDTVARLDALRGLAAQLIATSRLDEAARLLDQAEAAHTRFEPRPWLWDAELHALRADLAIEAARPDDAADHAERHLALVLERAPEDGDRILAARSVVARAAALQGRRDDALALWQQVHDDAVARYGKTHTVVAAALGARGALLYATGDLAAAEHSTLENLDVLAALHGPDHPSLVSALINLATIVVRSDPARAEDFARRAVAIARTDGATSERHLAAALHTLAGVLKERRRGDEAIGAESEAWSIHVEFRGASHPRSVASLCDLGEAQLAAGHLDQALSTFDKAREIELAARGQDSEGLIPALAGLVKAFDHAERSAEALVHAENLVRLAELADVTPARKVSIYNSVVIVLLGVETREAIERADRYLAAAETTAEHPLVSVAAREAIARRRTEVNAAKRALRG